MNPGALFELHRKLCVQPPMKNKIYLKTNSRIARLACIWLRSRAVALVWGRTIHLYGATADDLLSNPSWLAHEMVHVRQYELRGVGPFLASYLWEWVKHGYYNNRYEREARDVNRQWDVGTIFDNYKFEIK